MSLKIATNINSIMANKDLNRAEKGLSKSFEKLSSGLRINSSADDAVGLSLAKDLDADARVYATALQNVNNGISLLNIAESATEALETISYQIKEYAQEAANEETTHERRVVLGQEVNLLVDEFNRVASETDYNGISLLDTTFDNRSIQAGYGSNASIGISLADQLARNLGDGTFNGDNTFAFLNSATIGQYGGNNVDIDGDGNLDIIGFVGSNDVAVALGNGDGTFQNQVSHDVSQFINAGGDIEVGDLDGDDVLDMFVINYDYAHILIGNGDGTFNTLVTYQLGGDAFDGDLGDFNNDGILDVVSNNFFTSGDLFVRLGNGDGTFGDTVTYSTSGATMFQQELGDLNGDGQLDILTVTDTTASVFLGQSDGTFADEITTSHTTLGTFSLKDFDLDGELDYVVRQNATNIVFHKGNGDGTFAAGVTSTVTNANSISYADVNDDGYYDLVNNDTASTGYFLGNGDGTFGAYVEVEANGTNSISVGDYNSDGATDLIIQDTNLTTAYLANTNKESSLQYFDLTSSKTAEKAVGIITDTIDRINLEKGAQNAQRSRLSAAADVVAITSENYRTASDKILELDVADEVAEMVRLQIVQQAATAVLAQANQEGGRALSLLA